MKNGTFVGDWNASALSTLMILPDERPLDFTGQIKHADQITWLDPAPEASFFDHTILSPTFYDALDDHFQQFTNNYQ
jgi:hypothetical protein